jgi:hypothetical protein
MRAFLALSLTEFECPLLNNISPSLLYSLSIPAIKFSNVLLPQPDGPTIVTNSLSLMSSQYYSKPCICLQSHSATIAIVSILMISLR